MHAEARLAVALGLCAADVVTRQQRLLARYGLPTALPSGVTPAQLLAVMQRDKKVQAGQIRWALPRSIGHAEIIRDVPIAVVEQVLATVE